MSAPCRTNATAPKDCNTRLRFNEENGLSQLFAPSVPLSLTRRYLCTAINADKPHEELSTFPWPCLDGRTFSQHEQLIQRQITPPQAGGEGWPQPPLVPRQGSPRGQHSWNPDDETADRSDEKTLLSTHLLICTGASNLCNY